MSNNPNSDAEMLANLTRLDIRWVVPATNTPPKAVDDATFPKMSAAERLDHCRNFDQKQFTADGRR
jgi:hypothetical protein